MDVCLRLCSIALTTLGLVALFPPLAQADDARDACIDASERGQELRDTGKLLSARQKFLSCSREVCPALVRTDCASWLANVDARLPSVVVSAKGPDGRDIADVMVTLDRRPLLHRLDGKAISVDPGEHVFRYERTGRAPTEEKVILREGEQRRVLVVRFSDAVPKGEGNDKDRTPPMDRPVPVAVWILGGVAIAAGGVFGYVGLSAKNEFDEAADPAEGCAPGCSEDKVSSIRTKEIIANTALGAGVGALGVATVLLLTRPSVPRKVASPAATIDFRPMPGGAMAVLSGRFAF